MSLDPEHKLDTVAREKAQLVFWLAQRILSFWGARRCDTIGGAWAGSETRAQQTMQDVTGWVNIGAVSAIFVERREPRVHVHLGVFCGVLGVMLGNGIRNWSTLVYMGGCFAVLLF